MKNTIKDIVWQSKKNFALVFLNWSSVVKLEQWKKGSIKLFFYLKYFHLFFELIRKQFLLNTANKKMCELYYAFFFFLTKENR